MSNPLIAASRVKGTAVYNAEGDKLGHVEDLMLDKVSGRVAYAVMAFGGFLKIGEQYHPLPWSLLSYDLERRGYVVPLDREALQSAPTLGRHQFDDDDTGWRDAVHSHYRTEEPRPRDQGGDEGRLSDGFR